MKKIKVLRIIARLNIGGPAIHTVLLTEGLDKARFKTIFVYGNIGKDEGDMSYYAREKDVKPLYIPQLRRELNVFNDIVSLLRILKLIFAERPDIIHTHTAKAGTLGRAAGIIYNICNPFSDRKMRLVHTFHGHVFEGYFCAFKTKLFIYIERLLSYFTSKIITVSATVKNELIALGITRASKIEVIPLGFELDKFLNIAQRESDILSIGVIGRLVPIKNHRLFLDSVSKFLKYKPEVGLRFKIIGDGELRRGLENYSRILGISDHIDFLGWQKDLVRVYSDLDIVVLTSLSEGTPVSLIEAMASARPVVATDVGGIKDLLGNEIRGINNNFKVLERGIIVKSGDVNGFGEALVYLLDNPELRKGMGISGREYVKRNFGKERLIRDIEELYCNILSGIVLKDKGTVS